MNTLRRCICLVISAVVVSLFVMIGSEVSAAEATKFPERDIVLIVPGAPGGGFDLIARAASPFLKKYLPKPVNVIVQNVSGAGARAATFNIYDAKPDGYTLGMVEPVGVAVTSALGQAGERDLRKFTWLPRASTAPYAIGVSPQSPIKTLAGLKEKKGQKISASASFNTLAGSVGLLKHFGVDPQMVIYAGGADSCLAAMRGDVDLVIQVAATVIRQAEASDGKLIPLAVFDEARLPAAPNLPTAKEAGIDLPADLRSFLTHDYVFVAPPGMPAAISTLLSEALKKTLNDPAFGEQLNKIKLTVAYQSPDEVKNNSERLYRVTPQFVETMKQAVQK